MKRIRLNTDVGLWGKKGRIYDISDSRSKWLLKKRLVRNNNGIYSLTSLAELVEDLGRHIGRSKHTYDRNGPSKAFGPGQPPDTVTTHDEILETVLNKLNSGIKIFECKLCGYRNNPDVYAMVKIKGRWYHKFCLDKASRTTLRHIRSGRHDKVKILEMFNKSD